jgi:hypothetical protein
MRTTSVAPVLGGMKSVTAATPESVSHSVRNARDDSRYRRLTRFTWPAGATSHRPWSGVPSSAAMHAPLSKRGMQSQSMDPSRPTSAPVRQSPMSA